MKTTTRARELARDTAIEAARQLMAVHLRQERAACLGQPDRAGDLEMYRLDALQSLRDCLTAERATR